MMQLPYTLSDGVVAREDGLEFDAYNWDAFSIAGWLFPKQDGVKAPDGTIHVSWPTVAHVCRYRKGEPWCAPLWATNDILCGCDRPDHIDPAALHKNAVILCDSAESLRVLGECIRQWGGE